MRKVHAVWHRFLLSLEYLLLYMKGVFWDMKQPLISIVIPVYNVGSYLSPCLNSILGQTYKNIEIILVNDGSTDGSQDLCRTYARKDQRIILIEQSNQGLSAARNAGLRIARGAYITFLDSDDYLLGNALEVMCRYIEKYQADLCICGFIMKNSVRQVNVNSFSEPTVFEKRELVYQYISTNTISSTVCAKMYCAELLKDVVFPVGKINEDAFVLPGVLNRANRAICIPESLYVQNLREGSIMRGSFSKKHLDFIECQENIMQFVSTHYPEWSDRVAYSKYYAIAGVMAKILSAGAYRENSDLYKSLDAMLHQEYERVSPLVTSNTKLNTKYSMVIRHPLMFKLKFYTKGIIQRLKNRVKHLMCKLRS